MSRSHRRIPIFGITTCRSERQDKTIWHKRLRARERTALNSTSPDGFEAYLPLLENQVSNVWSMGKDGRQYWSFPEQKQAAHQTSRRKGNTARECTALEQRLLHKWMGK
jgi:hypothetical protein